MAQDFKAGFGSAWPEKPTQFPPVREELTAEVSKPARSRPSKPRAAKEEVCQQVKIAQRARKDVIRVLRSCPRDKLAELGIAPSRLESGITDAELLEAFAKVEDPASFARARLGVAPGSCSILNARLAEALQPVPNERASKYCSWAKCILCTAACCLSATLLGLGIAVVIKSIEEAEWKQGQCQLKDYSAGDCSQLHCPLDVRVWDAGQERVRRQWLMPWVKEAEQDGGALRMESPPFVCCKLECCSWYDPDYDRYCDDWPKTFQDNGDPCPTGKWDCRFKDENGEISELEVRMPDDTVLMLVYAMIATCLLGVCLACWYKCRSCCPECWPWSCHPGCPNCRCCARRTKKPNSLEKNDADSMRVVASTSGEDQAFMNNELEKDDAPTPQMCLSETTSASTTLADCARAPVAHLFRPICTPPAAMQASPKNTHAVPKNARGNRAVAPSNAEVDRHRIQTIGGRGRTKQESSRRPGGRNASSHVHFSSHLRVEDL